MNTSVLCVYTCQSNTPLFVIALCAAIRHKSRQLAALIRTLFFKGELINQPWSGGWADLSLVPGSVSRAPPLPPRGFGRSSSGSAGAGRGQEVRSVCGDETHPPRGLLLRCLWVWAEQSRGGMNLNPLFLLSGWMAWGVQTNIKSVFFSFLRSVFEFQPSDMSCVVPQKKKSQLKGKHITLWCPWQCEYNQKKTPDTHIYYSKLSTSAKWHIDVTNVKQQRWYKTRSSKSP